MESVSSQSIAVCLSARHPDAAPRPRIDLADFGGEAEQEVVAESKQIVSPDVQHITPVQRPGGSREPVVSPPPLPQRARINDQSNVDLLDNIRYSGHRRCS